MSDPKKDSCGDEASDQIFLEHENANLANLITIFNQVSHHNHNRLAQSQKDCTLTYREFILMLKV